MSQYKLNIIPFNPTKEKINFVFSTVTFEGAEPIPVSCLPKEVSFATIAEFYYWKKDEMPYILSENAENSLVEVNLRESKKFAKVYYTNIFFNRINKLNLKYKFNFIAAPQFFILDQSIKYPGFKSFKKFTIRVLTERLKTPFSLMISYDGYSYLSNKSVNWRPKT
jgi:hypothetical protein